MLNSNSLSNSSFFRRLTSLRYKSNLYIFSVRPSLNI